MSQSPNSDTISRCEWCGTDPLYVAYHDEHWGVPVHDDSLLFQFLTLEGAQAGLSWITILRKRSGYQQAFHGFDVQRVASMTQEECLTLMSNPEIVRNRLKISSTVTNAQAFLQIQQEFGSFDAYLWGFTDGKSVQNAVQSLRDIPAQTPLADQISKDLKKRGFRFVGPTIIYAFMQAVGMVNDHEKGCFRYAELVG